MKDKKDILFLQRFDHERMDAVLVPVDIDSVRAWLCFSPFSKEEREAIIDTIYSVGITPMQLQSVKSELLEVLQ